MKSNSISATSEVTPLELVSAYAPFANGGIGVQPRRYVYMARITGRTMPAWTGRVYTSGSQTTSGIRAIGSRLIAKNRSERACL
jgi:membrane peptidoglycan carboxypeptidase